MTLGWKAEGDFEDVVDTLESVVLRRQGCLDDTDTLEAWRFREIASTLGVSKGGVRRVETIWQLPLRDLQDPPSPNDVIVDESGVVMTIRDVARRQGLSRYQCDTRRTELHPATVERLDIDRPVYVTTSEGLVIDRWERIRVAVEGFFDEQQTGAYELSVVCDLPIEVGDRVSRHRGEVFRVESFESTASGGDPLVVALVEDATYAA